MRTILVVALWLLAGWNLGAFLEFVVGLPTWLGVVGGLGAGLLAARSTLRRPTSRDLAAHRLSFHRR